MTRSMNGAPTLVLHCEPRDFSDYARSTAAIGIQGNGR